MVPHPHTTNCCFSWYDIFFSNHNNVDHKNNFEGGKEDEVFDESSGLRAERVRWSEDGQLLAISTCSAYDSGRCTYAACHVMLAQLPVVGACHGTTVAYLTSLTEVTIQDPILQVVNDEN